MKLRLGSIFFQFKLTLLFVVFGLVVGYSSYLVNELSKAKRIVNHYMSTDENPVSAISGRYGNDWMLKLSDVQAREEFEAIIPPEFKDSILIEFFYKDSGDKTWYLLKNSSTEASSVHEADPGILPILDDAVELNIIQSKHELLEINNLNTLYLNVTRPGDLHNYVIKITINRKGLIHFIANSMNGWLTYTIITLIISLIVGFLFSISITRPIRKLSDNAIALSRGNFKIRFESKRLDDIGNLSRALNEMAINIEDRIATIETMNKIDKAVNSSLSREHLLSKISVYIAAQFNNSTVIVLGKGNNFYRLLAYAPEDIKPIKTELKYRELPKDFILKDQSVFELSEKEVEYIAKFIPLTEGYVVGISIPLMQAEHMAGLLIMVTYELAAREKVSLELLADQVSVALLSMQEVEDRKSMYNAMLLSLTRTVDTKSRWTAGHSERVTTHAVALAEGLGLNEETREKIRIASLLHDIGKLGISEAILDKPDKLTEEEFAIIRKHPSLGEAIIKDIPNFDFARSVVRYHHERWDGHGYPDGLAKDNIPMVARIVAIADVWDAITADRPYRKGFTQGKALEIMESEREELFDPALLDIFLEIIDPSRRQI